MSEESTLRVDLAACYRLVAHFGWDDLIFTHISARVPGPEHHFLINPYGMLFDEITASSLVKVDQRGEKVDDSPHPINPAGFVIHSAVHAARPDVVCVLHVHSQQSTIALASLGYHDYEGIALRDDEKPRLVSDLGDKTSLILRNHGLLTVGPTIADAFLYMYLLQRACEIQLLAQSGGGALVSVDESILSGVEENVAAVLKGAGGGLAWPGLLRRLDRINPGYRS
jgi:ribulose-5-phosphate 4-epimerase/fuculose-1-phosphate aldolase